MRIFTRILKVLLAIVFVLSIILNIILGISSSTITLYTNKKKALHEMYYSSIIALTNPSLINFSIIVLCSPFSLNTTGEVI